MQATSDAARIDKLWKEDMDRLKWRSVKNGVLYYKLTPRYSFPTMPQLPPVSELVGNYKIIYATGHLGADDDRMDRTADGTVVIQQSKYGLLQGVADSEDIKLYDLITFDPSFSFVQRDHHGDNSTTGCIDTVLTPDPRLKGDFAEHLDNVDAAILQMRCSVMVISQPVELDWTPEGFTFQGYIENEEERLARFVARHDYEKNWIHSHLGLPDACGKLVYDYWQFLPSPTFSLLEGDLLLHAKFLNNTETYLVARREVD